MRRCSSTVDGASGKHCSARPRSVFTRSKRGHHLLSGFLSPSTCRHRHTMRAVAGVGVSNIKSRPQALTLTGTPRSIRALRVRRSLSHSLINFCSGEGILFSPSRSLVGLHRPRPSLPGTACRCRSGHPRIVCNDRKTRSSPAKQRHRKARRHNSRSSEDRCCLAPDAAPLAWCHSMGRSRAPLRSRSLDKIELPRFCRGCPPGRFV